MRIKQILMLATLAAGLLLPGCRDRSVDPREPAVMRVTEAALSGDAQALADALKETGLDLRDFPQSKDWNHPLIRAVGEGDMEAVRILLDAGADVNTHWHGDYPLGVAVGNNNREMVLYLLERGASFSPGRGYAPAIVQAAWRGNADMVALLLEHGADPNAMDYSFRTALSIACNDDHKDSYSEGYLRCVRLLLDAGAKPDAQKGLGWTPLIELADNYRGPMHAGLFRTLLEAGADVNARDDYGCTALMHAVRQPESVRMLLEAGADVNAVDNNGKTPLLHAAAEGDVESARLLVEAGANPHARCKRGRTTLMWAVWGHAREDMLRYLLTTGVDPHAVDKEGRTALQFVECFCTGCPQDRALAPAYTQILQQAMQAGK